jgi:hypothetical protein
VAAVVKVSQDRSYDLLRAENGTDVVWDIDAGMTGSFKHAAHLLSISPSAVSAQLIA